MLSAATRRWIFWLPPALALTLVIAWLFRPEPVAVDFATIAEGPLTITVSDEGETRIRNVFVVSAPLTGLMRRIDLKAGDEMVARKTVVARIEPTDPALLDQRGQIEARAAIRAAEAAQKLAVATIQRAQAEVEFANIELKRVRGLMTRETVSQATLDSAERLARTAAAGLQEAQAGLDMRNSELEQARARLIEPSAERRPGSEVAVYSPVSGRVLRVLKESEGVVNSGTALIEVGDPRLLEVVVDLLSTDAVRVAAGQRVIIDYWGGPRPLEGRVQRVEPFGFTKISALGVEEQRVNVIIDIASPPEEWRNLGHGYRVEPRIVLRESASVLKAPLAALFRDGDRWAVFVRENDRALLRHVTLGAENSLEGEILEGLKSGDQVVLHPNEQLSTGIRVRQR